MAKKFKTHKEYIDYMVNTLAKDGKNLVESAYRTKGFQNQTYNLKDSYGSAVYYDGVLQVNSIYTMSPESVQAKKWYGKPLKGESEIFDFLREYSYPKKGKGFELIIVAAMPYASILEHGQGNLRRKYQVISGVKSEVNALANKYNGISRQISTSRIV